MEFVGFRPRLFSDRADSERSGDGPALALNVFLRSV